MQPKQVGETVRSPSAVVMGPLGGRCAAVGGDLVLRCGQRRFQLPDLSEDVLALVDHDL